MKTKIKDDEFAEQINKIMTIIETITKCADDGQTVLDDILVRAINDKLISGELISSAIKMKKYIKNVNAALDGEKEKYEEFLTAIKENDKKVDKLV